MKFTRRIMVFLLCFTGMAFGQKALGTHQKTKFNLSVGLERMSAREDLLIPLRFDGPGLVLGAGASKIIQSWMLALNTCAAIDFVSNRFDHPGVTLIYELRLGEMRRVMQRGQDLSLYLGGSQNIQLNNLFLYSWDDAHLYWFSIRSLNADLRVMKSVPAIGHLALDVSFPVLASIARPPVQRLEKQDPSLMRLGLFDPEWSREYELATWSDY